MCHSGELFGVSAVCSVVCLLVSSLPQSSTQQSLGEARGGHSAGRHINHFLLWMVRYEDPPHHAHHLNCKEVQMTDYLQQLTIKYSTGVHEF